MHSIHWAPEAEQAAYVLAELEHACEDGEDIEALPQNGVSATVRDGHTVALFGRLYITTAGLDAMAHAAGKRDGMTDEREPADLADYCDPYVAGYREGASR